MERDCGRGTQPHLEHQGHGLGELTGHLGSRGARGRKAHGGEDWVGSSLVIPEMLIKLALCYKCPDHRGGSTPDSHPRGHPVDGWPHEDSHSL